jgi:hypothetical protein
MNVFNLICYKFISFSFIINSHNLKNMNKDISKFFTEKMSLHSQACYDFCRSKVQNKKP